MKAQKLPPFSSTIPIATEDVLKHWHSQRKHLGATSSRKTSASRRRIWTATGRNYSFRCLDMSTAKSYNAMMHQHSVKAKKIRGKKTKKKRKLALKAKPKPKLPRPLPKTPPPPDPPPQQRPEINKIKFNIKNMNYRSLDFF